MAKKEKKPKSKKRKIIEWSITGFFMALVLVVAGFRIYQAATGNSSVFGTLCPVVLTDSMETDYMVGDVVIVKSATPEEIKERFDNGETIDLSFKWNIGTVLQPNIQIMTHRIIDVVYYANADENEDYNYKYSDRDYAYDNKGFHYTFVTHGINKTSNQGEDGQPVDCSIQLQFSTESELVGRVEKKSQFLRVANQAFSSVWTLVFLILIPGLYVTITSVIDLFKTLDDDDEQEKVVAEVSGDVKQDTSTNKNDPLAGMSEEDKERLKKEMLDELLGKKGK